MTTDPSTAQQGQAPTAPPAPTPAATPGSEDKGGGLAARVDTIESKLDRILAGLHGQAADATEAKLDANTQMEEAARREIQRLRDEEAAQARQQQAATEHDQLKADVAALKEKPPQTPVRRVTKLMWGGRQ